MLRGMEADISIDLTNVRYYGEKVEGSMGTLVLCHSCDQDPREDVDTVLHGGEA